MFAAERWLQKRYPQVRKFRSAFLPAAEVSLDFMAFCDILTVHLVLRIYIRHSSACMWALYTLYSILRNLKLSTLRVNYTYVVLDFSLNLTLQIAIFVKG